MLTFKKSLVIKHSTHYKSVWKCLGMMTITTHWIYAHLDLRDITNSPKGLTTFNLCIGKGDSLVPTSMVIHPLELNYTTLRAYLIPNYRQHERIPNYLMSECLSHLRSLIVGLVRIESETFHKMFLFCDAVHDGNAPVDICFGKAIVRAARLRFYQTY